jgi:lipoprotein-anchoring transpeptidase ErfK/SrfK
MRLTRRLGLLTMIVVAVPGVLTGCTSGSGHPDAAPASPSPAAAPPTVSLTPATGGKDVPVSAEITAAATNGQVTEVTLTDDKGATVPLTMRADGSSWVPATPLAYERTYTAQATVAGAAGLTATQATTFSTMSRPARTIDSTLYFAAGQTYGVAMPITLNFAEAVPEAARAQVQKRLFVTTDPPQPGAWHWLATGTEVFYRAPDYWQPGTTISVRTALEGLPMGGDLYGDADRTATSKISDSSVFLDVDNATKQMTVTVNGAVTRTIPVSMGKPGTPTSSGKMVIMEKFDWTTFDTRNDPQGGYVVTVANAQRLTWGGEFIHAAPWSVGDQGHSNVSHGCTNVSDEASAYLMNVTHVGDQVTIKGTEVALDMGNGWTAWNLDWADFVKGSALPVPPDLVPAAQKAAAAATSPPPATPQPATSPSGR